jgi:hypothetical protein
MNEINAATRQVIAALRADNDLAALVQGVYLRRAPQGTPSPYVSVTPQSASDINSVAGCRAYTELLYNVQVVGVTETAEQADALEAAAARIDTIFTSSAASGTVATDTALFRPALSVKSCARVSAFDYEETSPSSGAAIQHLGGLYRVVVRVPAVIAAPPPGGGSGGGIVIDIIDGADGDGDVIPVIPIGVPIQIGGG